MDFIKSFLDTLFCTHPENFTERAMTLFRYQATENKIYAQYLKYLDIKVEEVRSLTEIPFLPINFFKTHEVVTGSPTVQKVFTSSGTSGQQVSKSILSDESLYDKGAQITFEKTFGPLKGMHILALLPGYLERENSSLVHMVKHFIDSTASEHSGFYLDELDLLHDKIISLLDQGEKVMLWGVTFALLEFSSRYPGDYNGLTIMETGGMKGHGPELTRTELWKVLQDRMKNTAISSEYGMTELLSQAYCGADGIFTSPPWMRVLVRDVTDPFAISEKGAGGINVIDLANIHTCAFIETQDQGRLYDDGQFEVLGRLQGSEIRGCNLLISSLDS